MSWLGNLRIGVRMSILVGLAFVGLAGILAIYLFADGRLAHFQSEAGAFEAIREKGAAIRLGAFDMRRREKDFLLRNDLAYVKQYKEVQQNVLSELRKMKAMPAARAFLFGRRPDTIAVKYSDTRARRKTRRYWNSGILRPGANIAPASLTMRRGVIRTQFSTLTAAVAAIILTAGSALAGPAVIQIPEPSSLALIAAGAGVVAWVKFRRR